MESQFELIKPFVIYKIEKGKPESISNETMTDEKAIRFLQVDPERIRVFKRYPENWEQLVKGEEQEEQECLPCEREKLMSQKMNELKEAYPDIPTPFGMKKEELVDAIIESKQ